MLNSKKVSFIINNNNPISTFVKSIHTKNNIFMSLIWRKCFGESNFEESFETSRLFQYYFKLVWFSLPNLCVALRINISQQIRFSVWSTVTFKIYRVFRRFTYFRICKFRKKLFSLKMLPEIRNRQNIWCHAGFFFNHYFFNCRFPPRYEELRIKLAFMPRKTGNKYLVYLKKN